MAGLSIRQKPSGTWEYRFDAGIVDGKRKQITKAGFKTKKECTAAGTKALNEYNNAGCVFTPSEITVSDFLDLWVEQYCRVNLKDTTTVGYVKKIKNHIKPAIGIYKLKAITPTVLQDLINDIFNNGYSRNTLTGIKGILNNSFDYAVRMGFIRINPSMAVKMPLPRAEAVTPTRKKDREVYTPEEIKTIFERFPEGHPTHLAFVLAYKCGLRSGEVFGLMEEDIDIINKTIKINRQIQWNEDSSVWEFKPPKYDSYRTVNLDDSTVALLSRTLKQIHKGEVYYEDFFTRIYRNGNQLVSVGPNDNIDVSGMEEIHPVQRRDNGTYIQQRVMQHAFRVIHYDLNIPNKDFHSLRHTHATELLEAHVPLSVIQYRLGHANIDSTMIYTNHVTQDMIQSMMDILNKKEQ